MTRLPDSLQFVDFGAGFLCFGATSDGFGASFIDSGAGFCSFGTRFP
jgi:hypothetical protein